MLKGGGRGRVYDYKHKRAQKVRLRPWIRKSSNTKT